MNTPTIPTTEVGSESSTEERSNYELAFHVLPTVVEGEILGIVDSIKESITVAGGEITSSEAPERVDLAYQIDKMIEGKWRHFNSAYFGWMRFKLSPESLANLTETVDGHPKLLRHLLIKLTKAEITNPFYFHESLKDEKMVTSAEESEVVPDITTVESTDTLPNGKDEKKSESEDTGEVSDEALDESLDKITGDKESPSSETA